MYPTALFIRKLDGNWRGDARLYRLNPPMSYLLLGEPEEGEEEEGEEEEGLIPQYTAEYVIVSGVEVLGESETYIFPAREDGTAINMLELPGSFKGDINHEQALEDAGYRRIITPTYQSVEKEKEMRGEIYVRGPWQIPCKARALCSDGVWRMIKLVGQPDTYYTIPASAQVKGKTVAGFVMTDTLRYAEPTLIFVHYSNMKNGKLLPEWPPHNPDMEDWRTYQAPAVPQDPKGIA